ncbi:MAG: hypothetical protein EB027_06100, partial [Actinobacteria bacterium]|nr:hypothetical protein [Actinomycetota bacterium]
NGSYWKKVRNDLTEGDSAYGTINPSYLAGGGDAGGLLASTNTDLTLNFVRAGLQADPITLGWQIILTQGQTTASSDDFRTLSGTVVVPGDFNSTADVRTIPVTIPNFFVADRNIEDNETFQLVFTAPSNLFTFDWVREGYGDGRDRAAKNILTIDAQIRTDDIKYSVALHASNAANSPTFSGAYQVVEGANGATTPIKFVISRAVDADNDGVGGFWGSSSIGWRVAGVGPYAAGVTADDFWGASSGTVYFNGGNELTGVPAQLTQEITVFVKGDYKVERGERFRIELFDASTGYVVDDANVGSGIATALILNDDTGVTISDVFNREQDSGAVTHTYTVKRVGDLNKLTTMDWAKFNVSTDDVDFTGTLNGSLSFSATTGGNLLTMFEGYGEESQTVSVATTTNAVPGSDKYFDVQLSNFNNGGIQDPIDTVGRGSILNDDAQFSARLPAGDSGKRVEGDGVPYAFIVARSHLTPQSQTIDWSTVAAGGRLLANATDFPSSAFPTGSITFNSFVASETTPGAAGVTEVQTVTPTSVSATSQYGLQVGSTLQASLLGGEPVQLTVAGVFDSDLFGNLIVDRA